jgi:hypothetical protein
MRVSVMVVKAFRVFVSTAASGFHVLPGTPLAGPLPGVGSPHYTLTPVILESPKSLPMTATPSAPHIFPFTQRIIIIESVPSTVDFPTPSYSVAPRLGHCTGTLRRFGLGSTCNHLRPSASPPCVPGQWPRQRTPQAAETAIAMSELKA